MKRMLVLVLTMAIAGFVMSTLYAQQHAEHGQTAAAKGTEPQVVFCPTMKTGQLCSEGTTAALNLPPDKAQAWVAAVRKFNRAVNEATVQLQAEAKDTLTPAQMAEVQRWFAVGVNPQINQLLAAPGNAKAGQK